MTNPDGWPGRGVAAPAPAHGGLSRRARVLIVTAEAVLATVLAGLALRDALGWTLVGVAVLIAVGALLLGHRGWAHPGDPATPAAELVARLRTVGVHSRSSGDVGVLGDGQGYAAGLELDIAKGAVLDLGALCGVVAGDPSRPSALQMRLTSYAPPAPGTGVFRRARGATVAVHRRLHLLLRLEPAWAGDVVARHGGGAQGSRAALVAALDRLAARLRRAGVANRVLDAAALNALVAEDTAAELPVRLLTADLAGQADLDRLIAVVERAGAERGVVSLTVDFASGDEWVSTGTVLISGRDAEQLAAVEATLRSEPAAVGPAPPAALAGVLPLGGGPGDLTAVLTLARL